MKNRIAHANFTNLLILDKTMLKSILFQRYSLIRNILQNQNNSFHTYEFLYATAF